MSLHRILVPSFFLLLQLVGGWPAALQPAAVQAQGRVTTSPSSASPYLPERWGTIQLQYVNLGDEPIELLASTYFDEEPTLQYARRAWVPAKSRLFLPQTLKLPTLEETKRSFDFHTILMDPKAQSEVLVRATAGDLQLAGSLRLGKEPSTAIVNVPKDLIDTRGYSELAYELVVAAKTSQSLGRLMAQLNDPILPATPEAYEPLDQIVIADNRITTDEPAIVALRRWLYNGGHLWVLLDRIDPLFLERLLGDELRCEVVDQVELSTVRIEPTGRTSGGVVSERHYDQAVAMTRAIVSNVEVECNINGWPAAFWKACGEGKLLVTTLEPDGWMRPELVPATPETARAPSFPSPPGGQPSPPNPRAGGPGGRPAQLGAGAAGRPTGQKQAPPQGRVAPPPPNVPPPPPPPANPQEEAIVDSARTRVYVVVPIMNDIASEFFAPRSPRALRPAVLEPHVQEYVGKSVPSRWFVSSVMIGFAVVLAGTGAALWRKGLLEWLGVAGPALAIGIGAVLLMIGVSQRSAVPSTVANVQFVEPIPGTGDLRVSGVADIYAPGATNTVLGSRSGGWIVPDRTGQKGQLARMVWTDMDRWEWKHLPPTSGQRIAPFITSQQAARPIQARAAFGPDGLSGRLSIDGDLHSADAIVATRDGRIGAALSTDGSFTASADHVFSSEQYISAELLSDEQNRRGRTLAALFADSQESKFPQQPTLLVWTDPLDIRFQFDEKHRQVGSALLAVPLALDRPAPGTEILIPSPFLSYRTVAAPDGTAASGLYDHRRREWQDRSFPTVAWMRFQVPASLLPLEPTRARLTVQVVGPMGKLEIAGVRGKEAVPLKTWTDPVGTLSADLSDPALLNIVNGGLLLRLSAGDASRPQLTRTKDKINYWKIESLRLDLYAKAAEPSPAPPAKEPR